MHTRRNTGLKHLRGEQARNLGVIFNYVLIDVIPNICWLTSLQVWRLLTWDPPGSLSLPLKRSQEWEASKRKNPQHLPFISSQHLWRKSCPSLIPAPHRPEGITIPLLVGCLPSWLHGRSSWQVMQGLLMATDAGSPHWAQGQHAVKWKNWLVLHRLSDCGWIQRFHQPHNAIWTPRRLQSASCSFNDARSFIPPLCPWESLLEWSYKCA